MKDTDIELYVIEQSKRIGIKIPEIFLSSRFTYSLGAACLSKHALKLNKSYIHKTNDIYAKSIILHELLHLKNWIENGSRLHDTSFKQMCDQYGCHSQSVFTSKQKNKLKHKYTNK